MSWALVYGGAGQLGLAVVRSFKQAGWKVISADFRAAEIADHSVHLDGKTETDTKLVLDKISELGAVGKIDTVITVAGGFAMGSVKDDGIFASLDKMLSMNVYSAFAAAHVAAKTLKEGGLLVLTGAEGALKPTPHYAAYGASKAAVHQLLQSLATPDGGLPKGASAVALLPITMDTAQNRKDMPTANFDNWTPLETVASTLLDWAANKGRPAPGSKMLMKTVNKVTTFAPT